MKKLTKEQMIEALTAQVEHWEMAELLDTAMDYVREKLRAMPYAAVKEEYANQGLDDDA